MASPTPSPSLSRTNNHFISTHTPLPSLFSCSRFYIMKLCGSYRRR
ncbi:hypothetical protein KC19_8G044000 [Ceratodon purpureus]|uniref:Uncharacterized protein n=1 Tax=Ceratodon purpureus TaxID=3225 RepID=A0A8T0H0L9_CERPU|nr:hypothetical protein KC19_8G044000 [Ceratodon purpureus]